MQAGQVWDAVAQPELSPHQLFKRFRAGSATPHELAKVLRNNQGMQNTIKVSALDAYTEATPPATVPPGDWMDLRHKLTPSEQWPEDVPTPPLCVSRGQANVTKLQKCLVQMDDIDWSDQAQQKHGNATLTRAAHDRIGVAKIIFMFSDDLLTHVFRHAWWLEWKEPLEQIFASIGVDPNKIIRCMLARLPPKTHIGIHHDTGRWATVSHRVHVPIFTDPTKVVFRSGRTPSTMHRWAFNEGECFELNNRAKHQVYNGWSRERVHLIFDWVEDLEVLRKIRFMQLGRGQVEILSRRGVIGIQRTSDDGNTEIADTGTDSNPGTVDALVTTDARAQDLLPALIREDQCPVPKTTRVLESTMRLWASCTASYGLDGAEAFFLLFKAYCLGEVLLEDFVAAVGDQFGTDWLWNIEGDLVCACSDHARRTKLYTWYQFPHLNIADDRSPLFKPLHLTAPLPHFIILGAMKCGTTSLFNYILQHPQAIGGRQKEPHLFDWRWDYLNAHGLSEDMDYGAEALFRSRYLDPGRVQSLSLAKKMAYFFDVDAMTSDPALICGDGSPSYLMGGSMVAARIRSINPHARFLVILRDPVARAMSHYNMMKDKNDKHLGESSFESVVDEDIAKLQAAGVSENGTVDLDMFDQQYLRSLPYGHGAHSYVGRGLYAPLLQTWFRAVGRENVLVLRLDEMQHNVQAVMDRVYNHLGLAPFKLESTEPKLVRKGRYVVDFDEGVLEKLRQFYAPHEQALEALLGSPGAV